MNQYDILILNASLDGSSQTVDIGIANGRIAKIAESIDGSSTETLNAAGSFVSRGFVDCHTHLDRVFAACGGRKPKSEHEDIETEGFGGYINAAFDKYHQDTSSKRIEQNAIRDIQQAVCQGTTHMRSHVAVDHLTSNENIRSVLRAKEKTEEIIDLQLVAMSSKGVINNPESEGYLRKAIETALEYDLTGDDILVGGVDPATRNRNIEETIDTWFNIATDYDIDIDVHIQDGGLLGQYTIERLADKMKKHGYEGRVTASHNFSLAHLPDWRVDELIATMKDVNLKTVTCYTSTRSNMPIKKLIKQGLSIGHGTDNHNDFVISHGDSDILRAALTEVNKLHGDRMEDKEYRWYETNEGLELIWDMITRQGASVLNLSGDYEIKEGEIADLLIFDQPSPQWSIINQAERSYVIKGGKIVAEDGKLESKYSEVE